MKWSTLKAWWPYFLSAVPKNSLKLKARWEKHMPCCHHSCSQFAQQPIHTTIGSYESKNGSDTACTCAYIVLLLVLILTHFETAIQNYDWFNLDIFTKLVKGCNGLSFSLPPLTAVPCCGVSQPMAWLMMGKPTW